MPITQERFMSVITAAKSIISAQSVIQETCNRDLENEIISANSVLAHTKDEYAQAIINQLLNRIINLRDVIYKINGDLELTELKAMVIAEEIHFARNGKSNQRAAFYQKRSRERQGIIPRPTSQPGPIVKPEQMPYNSTPTAEPIADFENTPEYRAFKQQMAKLHAELPQSPLTPDTIVIFDEAAPISEQAYANLKIPSEAGGGAAMAEPIASPSSIKNSPAMAETSPIGSTIVPKQHKDGITRYLPMAEDDNGPEISSETNLL